VDEVNQPASLEIGPGEDIISRPFSLARAIAAMARSFTASLKKERYAER
jgi:hypothetical protein